MYKKILVIDDEPEIVDLLSIILSGEGYIVEISTTGEEADRLHEISPDLLLLDLRMHGDGNAGASICIKIKTNPVTKNLPVVLISAEPNIARVARDCGANAYLKKPFDIDELLAIVKLNLNNSLNHPEVQVE